MALGLFAGSMTARAQQTKPTAEPESAPTIASVMEVQLRIVESQFVPAAEAMPEDKYSFAPTNGEYKEVRTFAQQVKHVTSERFSRSIHAGSSSKSREKIAACWHCALMTSSSGRPTPRQYLDARRFRRNWRAGAQEFTALRLAVVVF